MAPRVELCNKGERGRFTRLEINPTEKCDGVQGLLEDCGIIFFEKLRQLECKTLNLLNNPYVYDAQGDDVMLQVISDGGVGSKTDFSCLCSGRFELQPYINNLFQEHLVFIGMYSKLVLI